MSKEKKVETLARLSLDLDRQTGRGYRLRFCRVSERKADSWEVVAEMPEELLEELDVLHDKFIGRLERRLENVRKEK